MSEPTTPLAELTSHRRENQPHLAIARPVVGYRSRLGLLVLLLAYALTALIFSQVTPFNKGPDEGINLAYIEFITAKGRLPLTYAERDEVGPKANWPALYHLSVAGLGHLLGFELTGPPSIKIFWDSFRYRAIDSEADPVWYLLTEDQAPPYYGPILALHIGRWLSILFSLITLGLVYLTMRELFPDRPELAFVATALLAFIPQFIFVNSALNEDALVAALAALYFWLLVRVVKQPDMIWPYALLGLALALSVTAKYTTIILPLEVGLVLAVLARRQKYGWQRWGRRLALVGGCAVLASSWWFGWNFWFLNEIKERGLIAGLLRPLFTGGTDVTLARLGNFFSGGQIGLTDLPENTNVGTFPGWIWSTFLSFWGVFINQTMPFYPYAFIGIGLLLGAAIFGLGRLWRMEPSSRQWLLLLTFHVAIFFILPLIRFALSRRLGQTAQGRHILIPAAAAVVGLLVWGLATAIPRPWQRWLFSLLVLGFMGWTAAHLFQLNALAAPLLPMRTLPQAAGWLPQPVKAQFGESMELASYEVDPQPEQGLMRLNLAWRSLAHANENYLLKINLLDAQGQIVSHWLGYNGQGRLPTLAWDPGDVIFDRLALPLPNLPPGDFGVQIQVIGASGPLLVTEQGCGGAGVQGCDANSGLTLPTVSMSQSSTLPFPHTLNLDNSTKIAFALWPTAESTSPPFPPTPSYRYPATISIVVSPVEVEGTALSLQLVDDAGQEWPADSSEANIFNFVIGPRWASGLYRLKLTLRQGGNIVGQELSEPLLTVENWWPRLFAAPAIATPGEANFANQLKFLGYKLPQNQVKAGEAFPVTLYWQALPEQSPQANFIQFNHLLDSAGTLRGGYDRQPLEYYSTLLWAPGEVVIDGYTVPVDTDAPPGRYYLNVGYYLTVGEAAINLPLVVDGQMTETHSVTIGPIEVIAP